MTCPQYCRSCHFFIVFVPRVSPNPDVPVTPTVQEHLFRLSIVRSLTRFTFRLQEASFRSSVKIRTQIMSKQSIKTSYLLLQHGFCSTKPGQDRFTMFPPWTLYPRMHACFLRYFHADIQSQSGFMLKKHPEKPCLDVSNCFLCTAEICSVTSALL